MLLGHPESGPIRAIGSEGAVLIDLVVRGWCATQGEISCADMWSIARDLSVLGHRKVFAERTLLGVEHGEFTERISHPSSDARTMRTVRSRLLR